MFDCVLATRIARNASLFTPEGRINLRNARFADDPAPVQEDCDCYTCRTFSRAYLRHLYKAGEVTALRLGTIHNIHFVLNLMRQLRQAISQNTLEEFRKDYLANYRISDQRVRHEQRRRRMESKRGL
jgi:queuine tRNA-ribosyltransferase